MEQILETVKSELSTILSLLIGAGIIVLRERLAYHLKNLHSVDRTIDTLTVKAEAVFPSVGAGPEKKAFVKEELKSALKEQGVGLVKRLLIFGVGKIGTSIERSVKNKING